MRRQIVAVTALGFVVALGRGAPIILLAALLAASTACAGALTAGPPPSSILDQIFPGTGAIAPLAGQLVTSQYSRGEEYAADAHGVVLLRRAGYPKEMMVETLTWLMQVSGPDSGGFFATHPGTADRIAAVQKMP
jgi:predicted Zn-dependent protease